MCVSATMQTINRATLFEVYKLHVKNCTSVNIYFLQYICNYSYFVKWIIHTYEIFGRRVLITFHSNNIIKSKVGRKFCNKKRGN